jgi:hypothetical protein
VPTLPRPRPESDGGSANLAARGAGSAHWLLEADREFTGKEPSYPVAAIVAALALDSGRSKTATKGDAVKTSIRSGAAVALLVVMAACGSSSHPSPTAISPVLPSPTDFFPPLSGPWRTFVFAHELSDPVSGITKTSRFVLYDNGAFVLQYLSLGDTGFRGRYTRANDVLTFQFEASNVNAPWEATGFLKDSSLTVQYNGIMQLNDFENAVYVLMP